MECLTAACPADRFMGEKGFSRGSAIARKADSGPATSLIRRGPTGYFGGNRWVRGLALVQTLDRTRQHLAVAKNC